MIAPAFTPRHAPLFAAKPTCACWRCRCPAAAANALDFKRVGGGMLLQTADTKNVGRRAARGHPAPADRAELADLMFAWKVAKFVKSNAIVFCGGGMTLGVGAGQMSRLDSARIASIKAGNAGLTWPAPRWPATPSSRSATAWMWWSTPAPAASSSRGVRCATPR
jgi:phosphoribosylaminoimidazolecarboxamide formyltransferase / IMP cyclohydrolase